VKISRLLFALVALSVSAASAADLDAGRAKAATVCAACHGALGVSVSDAIPNLAGQKARYLEAQLNALKDGTRKNPIMNAIAAQLSADDIANVAAHFAAQQGAASGTAKSEFLPNVAKTSARFPESYKTTFTKYHTISFPDRRQVGYYFANDKALAAAKAGRPLPDGSVIFAEVWSAKLDAGKKPVSGADGQFTADQLLAYIAMEREPGWGRDLPDMLRNGDWNYAVFTPAKAPRPGINQAECLACHKPQDKASYVFTLKELAAANPR
jgi:cytochrome c553